MYGKLQLTLVFSQNIALILKMFSCEKLYQIMRTNVEYTY